MTVAIIDYRSGNLRSAAKAFERAAREAGLDEKIVVTDSAAVVRKADRVVLPGVGAFGDCRAGLGRLDGMIDALDEVVLNKGRPFLGICVGMQLMADRGLEYGEHPGLGWIDGEVRALAPDDPSLKIPHMGWNRLELSDRGRAHPVLRTLPTEAYAYFVHSYAMYCAHDDVVLGTVDYGGRVVAIVGRNNMIGTQFHPEKSQRVGLALIANFLTWLP
ncbi:MAG: imidazole glycerol phosphate synthase subunit HisH [Alphaproteobacteria bacterium]|nr:MAG: imidazole glycerol phosphate synthase subunit HisH [Alphaproteobacteria bacterium]